MVNTIRSEATPRGRRKLGRVWITWSEDVFICNRSRIRSTFCSSDLNVGRLEEEFRCGKQRKNNKDGPRDKSPYIRFNSAFWYNTMRSERCRSEEVRSEQPTPLVILARKPLQCFQEEIRNIRKVVQWKRAKRQQPKNTYTAIPTDSHR